MSYEEVVYGSRLSNLCILCKRDCGVGSRFCHSNECARQYIQRSYFRPQISWQQLWNEGYSMGYNRDPLGTLARRKYQDRRPGFDKTEELINNMYLYNPKRRDYALEKHRQGKFKRQVVAEQQFAQHQAYTAQSQQLKEKYQITPEKNEEIKAQFNGI